MAAGGYRVDLAGLRAGARGLRALSGNVRDSVGEPLVPPAGGNRGFVSAQAMAATAEAWTAELGQLATVLQTAGDKLAQTAAEYHRADAAGAHEFHRLWREL